VPLYASICHGLSPALLYESHLRPKRSSGLRADVPSYRPAANQNQIAAPCSSTIKDGWQKQECSGCRPAWASERAGHLHLVVSDKDSPATLIHLKNEGHCHASTSQRPVVNADEMHIRAEVDIHETCRDGSDHCQRRAGYCMTLASA
jgi:hypothetical protein